jgi:four helix bundle protein
MAFGLFHMANSLGPVRILFMTTAPIRSHEDLIVWQKAVDLVALVYEFSSKLPGREVYGMSAQMRRSAASIPANVAEGHGRETKKDYAHFVAIARGSLAETQTYVKLCVRLGYLTNAEVDGTLKLMNEIYRMLTVLKHKLQDSP